MNATVSAFRTPEEAEEAKEAMFDFCVGRPWPDPKVGLSIYTYRTEVQHGTMEEAEAFRDYADKQTGEKNFIYKLVQV
jgi:hypothetical protein